MSAPPMARDNGAGFLATRIGQDALAIAELLDLLAGREARIAELEARIAGFEADRPSAESVRENAHAATIL